MGQKVHPRAFRLGIIGTWGSRWFAKGKDYRTFLREDLEIRKFLRERLKAAGIASVDIERSGNTLTVTVATSKPGVVIGRGGTGVEDLKRGIERTLGAKTTVRLNIQEVSKPNLNAQIVMQNVIDQIEKRIPFRRALRQSVEQARRAGALGSRVMVSGRLNGADIARTEVNTSGTVPLQTLRADIDYARGTARTTYGAIGVKVWIYRGEVFEKDKKEV